MNRVRTCATIDFGPVPYHRYKFKHRFVTLLADDLDPEHGIVSVRVGFALRSAEIKPLFDSVFLSEDDRVGKTFILLFLSRLSTTLSFITWCTGYCIVPRASR